MRCAEIVVLLAATLHLSCATIRSHAPQIASATIEPSSLQPGQFAIVTVDVKDHFGIVTKVAGIVREDPRIPLTLRDDGKDPDQTAGDGIWTLKVDAPFMAPPGDFTLELSAYDSNDKVIIVRTPDGSDAPLKATCSFAITQPQK